MKISIILIAKCVILISVVKVKCQQINCNEPRPLSCPEIVCNLINSRKSDFCKDIQCEGIVPENCPVGSVFEDGLTMCNCCPGCAKYLDVGESCQIAPPPASLYPNCTDPYCPILMNDCKVGLKCVYMGASSRKCILDPNPSPGGGGGGNECPYKRNLGLTKQLHWTPNCDPDGTYSPKQCKGTRHDGTCFCVDPKGNRIFGREWWDKADNQKCGCSRHAFELREKDYIATIHCSSDGNYEPLQCDMDSGLCYCVDTITGKLNGAVLPEHQWKLLPCYSVNLTDGDPTGQYLRQCESQWGVGQRIVKEARLHGLDVYAATDFTCEADGSFGPLRRHQSIWYCVPKTGKLEESRGHFQEMEANENMNCRCFRDSLIHEIEEKPFTKTCDLPTGNYFTVSLFNQVTNQYSCVDLDGFFFGNPVPNSTFKCCLTNDCPGGTRCIDAAQGINYRPCDSFPT